MRSKPLAGPGFSGWVCWIAWPWWGSPGDRPGTHTGQGAGWHCFLLLVLVLVLAVVIALVLLLLQIQLPLPQTGTTLLSAFSSPPWPSWCSGNRNSQRLPPQPKFDKDSPWLSVVVWWWSGYSYKESNFVCFFFPPFPYCFLWSTKSSPRGALAFHESRRFHTRPLRLYWGPENVHLGP